MNKGFILLCAFFLFPVTPISRNNVIPNAFPRETSISAANYIWAAASQERRTAPSQRWEIFLEIAFAATKGGEYFHQDFRTRFPPGTAIYRREISTQVERRWSNARRLPRHIDEGWRTAPRNSANENFSRDDICGKEGRLVGWLVRWLVRWLVGCLVGCLVAWLADEKWPRAAASAAQQYVNCGGVSRERCTSGAQTSTFLCSLVRARAETPARVGANPFADSRI